MLGVGLMSGTSLDGVDAALVRFAGDGTPTLERFITTPYPPAFQQRLLALIAGGAPGDLALLDTELGDRFVDAVEAVRRDARIDFVASHGQTVWHEPGVTSLQIGNAAAIHERCGVPVVHDFRRADIAAGGQGAPLVPLADVLLFGAPEGPRTLLNIGGMANVTYVPRLGIEAGVIAFDTGPGVAVMDLVARAVDPAAPYDVDGRRAARGRPDEALLTSLLANAWFATPPPRSTGRERFGQEVADRILAICGATDDAVATATYFTTRSVTDQLDRWLPADQGDLVVSGGGARNATLMTLLSTRPRVHAFTDVFFDGDAKEALVFAWLGWRTLHGLPGNLPEATGARGARVLGSVVGRFHG